MNMKRLGGLHRHEPQRPNAADSNGKNKRRPLLRSTVQRLTCVAVTAATIATAGRFVPLTSLPSRVRGSAKRQATIPECEASPWKADEVLHGQCQGWGVKKNEDAKTVAECATSCCDSADCVAWQFRRDHGCLQGGDVRIGMEKDGPSAWCNEGPPLKWNGQFLKPHGKTEGMDADKLRKEACSVDTWNPDAENGQCFGLGNKKEAASGSARECMEACCALPDCGVWQWSAHGCFYKNWGFGCVEVDDPAAFEPYAGRRKRVESRQYTDNNGKPWNMDMTAL